MFERYTDTEFHQEFNTDFEETDTELTYHLWTEKKGNFFYLIRVTAEGGEVAWSPENLFYVKCGP